MSKKNEVTKQTTDGIGFIIDKNMHLLMECLERRVEEMLIDYLSSYHNDNEAFWDFLKNCVVNKKALILFCTLIKDKDSETFKKVMTNIRDVKYEFEEDKIIKEVKETPSHIIKFSTGKNFCKKFTEGSHVKKTAPTGIVSDQFLRKGFMIDGESIEMFSFLSLEQIGVVISQLCSDIGQSIEKVPEGVEFGEKVFMTRYFIAKKNDIETGWFDN
ncbi:MAG: hypothetical protein LBD46_04660 [Endomicrobium sp.]|jgi:hypothetical protein|nr:hypothetical protein [Endomicrobium sp.]